jgi:pimeloyl-ACP methyl ester carboxylesterase
VGDWADDVRAAAEAIPQARLELVPDAGDFLVIEHGHEVFTRLLESTSG